MSLSGLPSAGQRAEWENCVNTEMCRGHGLKKKKKKRKDCVADAEIGQLGLEI